MAPLADYAALGQDERLARLAAGPAALARALAGHDAAALTRRPAPESWAPVEVLCHLRDSEEWFLQRLTQMLLMSEPVFPRVNPDRWAEERQYLRAAAGPALDAFARRRDETLGFFRALAPDDWNRAGVHADSRGRRTVEEFLTVIAWHDDNHLDQLERALAGRP